MYSLYSHVLHEEYVDKKRGVILYLDWGDAVVSLSTWKILHHGPHMSHVGQSHGLLQCDLALAFYDAKIFCKVTSKPKS